MRARQARRRRPGKKATALGDFINERLAQLRYLSRFLNDEHGPRPVERDEMRDAALRAQAADIIAATTTVPYPDLSPVAVARFNALAVGAVVSFLAGYGDEPEAAAAETDFIIGISERGFAGAPVMLRSPTAQGIWAAWLADFLDNPQRERLRRCQSCRRWFVDETRNKSARRCSRACTIAWSNRQRKKKRGGRR